MTEVKRPEVIVVECSKCGYQWTMEQDETWRSDSKLKCKSKKCKAFVVHKRIGRLSITTLETFK